MLWQWCPQLVPVQPSVDVVDTLSDRQRAKKSGFNLIDERIEPVCFLALSFQSFARLAS